MKKEQLLAVLGIAMLALTGCGSSATNATTVPESSQVAMQNNTDQSGKTKTENKNDAQNKNQDNQKNDQTNQNQSNQNPDDMRPDAGNQGNMNPGEKPNHPDRSMDKRPNMPHCNPGQHESHGPGYMDKHREHRMDGNGAPGFPMNGEQQGNMDENRPEGQIGEPAPYTSDENQTAFPQKHKGRGKRGHRMNSDEKTQSNTDGQENQAESVPAPNQNEKSEQSQPDQSGTPSDVSGQAGNMEQKRPDMPAPAGQAGNMDQHGPERPDASSGAPAGQVGIDGSSGLNMD